MMKMYVSVMSSALIACALLVPTTAVKTTGSDVYLTPIKTTGPHVGIVLCQGAQIDASTYVPLATALQAAAPFQLWIAIPEFPLSVPEPSVASGVTRALKTLKSKGMPANATIVTAGHSLGGAQIQDWTFSNHQGISAQILMGSALLRKYRNGSAATTYPVPTMALGGTMDGLFRMTRHAENYYIYTAMQKNPNFPTILFEGVSHMQFASGTPPALVKANDLKPEVSYDTAHTLIAATITLFLESQINKNTSAAAALETQSETTGALVNPIILSQKMEAFPEIGQPCNTDFPLPSTCPSYSRFPSGQKSGSNPSDCVCGTPWSEKAQGYLGTNQTVYTVETVDGVHEVSEINPVHLPHIWTNCSSVGPAPCPLKTTTVTYPSYPTLTPLDTGFVYTSADELKTKLVSRQALLTAAGQKNVNFTETDVIPSLCAGINEMSWKWALSVATESALSRFNRIGIPMKFGKDIFLGNAGPLWIENPIEYQLASDKSALNVYSPCSHTPINYPIQEAAGYHYCKLVSPARTLEWIYLDGLRQKGGL
eukprot:m.260239 g.260239  ORF g.260239 m.260239 type:complete len:540 (+) comp39528_c0_seq1:66-1685(+)